MKTLFILLQKNQSLDNTNWDILIPIYIAIGLFFLNLFREYVSKQLETKKRLSNQLIETCDKMLRYAISYELSALEMRHCYAKYEINKNAEDLQYRDYYHHITEENDLAYDLLKSDLKKCVKDLNDSWINRLDINEILDIMYELVRIRLNNFEYDFSEVEKDETKVNELYKSLKQKVREEIVFTGVGFYLIMLQRILDPKSPTLYMDNETETKLLSLIESYRKTKYLNR